MKGVCSVCQAGVEEGRDELLVEVLADEDKFLHAVAELFIPIATETWILLHELLKFVLGHSGVPLAGITDTDLLTSLFKDVAGILFVVEVADTFGADDAFRPFASHEFVKESEVKGTATVIDVGSDAIFLSLTLIMVMVVVMLMSMMVFMMVFIVVMMVMMFMLIVVVIIIVVLVFVVMLLDLLNPGGRCGNLVEVEHIGIQYLIELYVAIVAVDDLGLGLEGVDDLSDTSQFLWADLCGFVQQHDVAKLNLLDDEVLDILLVDVLARQIQSAAKLVPHAEGIDDSHDTVETGIALLCRFRSQRGDAADGLGDGAWLADAAGLDDDVVEALQGDDVLQLLDEIHLQRTADATVLQGHERVVLLVDDTALLDEGGIDVDFSDVVDDDGKLDAALVA